MHDHTTASRVSFHTTALRALLAAGVAAATLVPARALAGEPNADAAGVTGGTAVAEESAFAPPPVEVKLRLTAPVVGAAHIFDDDVGGVAIVGGSAALDVAQWVTIEGGGTYSMVGLASAGTGYARAGLSPVVLDTRATNASGWTLQPQVLFGYEGVSVPRHSAFCIQLDFFDGQEAGSPCPTRSGALHAVTGTLGFDFTYHVADHFGVTMRPQLTLGGVAAHDGDEWGDEAPQMVTEPGISLGVAF